jgi:hypothetical protein
MSLMEASQLIPQVMPPYPLMYIDSFTKKQSQPQPAARVKKVGVYIELQPQAAPNEMAELNAQFVMADARETSKFILDNGLGLILLESRMHIEAKFGEAVKTLKVVEDDEGHQTLFCLLVYRGPLQDAKQALASFDRDWWLNRAGEFSDRLNFDFELA